MSSNNSYTKKFIKVFGITLSISLIFIILGVYAYNTLYTSSSYNPSKQKGSNLVTEIEVKAEEDSKSKNFLTPPVRTNVLITGFDKQENLTDVMMVASFISTTGEINLISIPRDTYISFSGDELKELRKINSGAPSALKLNELYAYTGKKTNVDFLQKTIENLLGININYYVKIDLNAFKKIVDAVGGIYFTVPEGGLKYSDPTQNLKINLKGGYQLLDGNAAEGLVRFRKGYARQDLQRVEVQQEFIKEFVKQVLNKETIVKNFGEIGLTLIKYVETNFSISDLPKYINSIENINTNNINTTTAPGIPKNINGISYYLINYAELRTIIDEYFYGSTVSKNEEFSTEITTNN